MGIIKEFISKNLEVITPYGVIEKQNIKPFKKRNLDNLKKELNYIEQIINSFDDEKNTYENIQHCFCRIKNISSTIKRLKSNLTLDEVELFEMKNFALISNKIKTKVSLLNLDIDYLNFDSLDNIISLLDPDNLNMPTFYIYDSYSEELRKIRKEKLNIENKILKESVKEKIVELKNKRLEIVIKEEKEEFKIRKKLSYELSNYIESFNQNIIAISKLDILIAKAKLAIKYNATKPSINENENIYFKDVINPEVDEILQTKNKRYMPISINIDRKMNIITGANMGGKSVSMKTIALNLYLFLCGFYVFAKEAKLPALDFIYLISDDMQDINSGLSTFGAEIITLKKILHRIKKENGFIVLDEFARGTNPNEGKILIKSICEHFKSFNSIVLISTHYDDITTDYIDHYQVVGLKNINLNSLKHKLDLQKNKGIDILQEYMDYRLEKIKHKTQVPKDAINICKFLGLQEEIINIANTYYMGDKNE